MYRKINWKTIFYMAVFIACSTSFAESAARKASEYPAHDKDQVGNADKTASDVVKKASDAADKAASDVAEKASDAADKASSDVVKKASDAADKAASDVMKKASDTADKAASDVMKKASGVSAYQGIILDNQQDLFKDYDLDKLLHKIRFVLEHNNLKNVNKQFHRLFGKKDSSVYSCSVESAALDAKSQTVKEKMVQEHRTDDQTKVADVKDHAVKETGEILKKAHDVTAQADQSDTLSSSKALYKEGYDFIRSANYVEAERSFCAFQNRYKKDPLSDDALFWLAESLLGQKRYYEAAQVYLSAWYADKKKLYTSEILLKLARSMIALEKNEKDCALFAKNKKHHQMLESVFCNSLK